MNEVILFHSFAKLPCFVFHLMEIKKYWTMQRIAVRNFPRFSYLKFFRLNPKITFPIWMKLFGGTVPPPKKLFGGTVPPPKKLFGGTVPPPKKLFGGTVPPSNKLFGSTVPPSKQIFGGTVPPAKTPIWRYCTSEKKVFGGIMEISFW